MDPLAALAPLEPGYDAALADLRSHLEPDSRVRALWLSGSVGRGTADAGSDLDVVVTVTDAEEFAASQTWDCLDPVIRLPIPGLPGSVAVVTRAGLRVDVVVESVADLAETPYRHRVPVFDRGGLRLPAPDDGSPDPIPAMTAVVTEVLRQAAIFPAAVVAREDWLLGQVAVHNYARLLYQLFAASNEPVGPMGVKQWSSRLTPDQRAVLAALPQPRADRDDVVGAMTAVRDAILTQGRAAFESAGGVWPTETVAALAAYWRRHGLAWA